MRVNESDAKLSLLFGSDSLDFTVHGARRTTHRLDHVASGRATSRGERLEGEYESDYDYADNIG